MKLFQKIMVNCWITLINLVVAMCVPSFIPLRLIKPLHEYYNNVLSTRDQTLIYLGLCLITFIWAEWCWIILQRKINKS